MNVTGAGITGSLFGTSSWANNAITASYILNAVSASFASTASFVNPLVQDVQITGSLFASSSNATQLRIGSNLLFVSSSGNVGLGTTLPSYRLDVAGSFRATSNGYFGAPVSINSTTSPSNVELYVVAQAPASRIRYQNTNTNGESQYQILNDASTVAYFSLNGTTAATSPNEAFVGSTGVFNVTGTTVKINTSAEAARIFNNGNIAIGTTTDAGFKLDVNGTSRFQNNMVVTGSVTATSFTGSLSGSASSATSASFASTASFVNPLRQDVIVTGSLFVSSSNATQFLVGTGSLFVSRSGDIGIGTTTPTTKLDVVGRGRFGSQDETRAGIFVGNPGRIVISNTYGGGYNVFLESNYSYDPFVTMGFGSGTNPLTATPSANFLEIGSENATFGWSGNVNLNFKSGGATRFMLSRSTYNFLINTTTDAGFRLDVNGTSRFTNNMLVTGSVTATSFTGSLSGSATSATSASFASTASFVTTAQTASYVLNAVSASFASTATSASFALTASNITPVISNDADTRVVTANGNGTLNGEGNLTFNGQTLSVLYGVGDEGGEILLGKAATNTTLTGSGITVDVFQNRLRFFEQGGAARGFYLDISTGGGGASTNLASGGGTVTSINTAGTVNGITLTGGPITGAGTITLGGTLSGITPSQLATSSIMIGSTSIALGVTASSLTGLTSVNATSFTGSLLGTASFATTATSASFAATSSFAASGFTVGISQFQTATVASSIVGANNLFTTPTGSFTGAKYLYTVTSGSNARMGEIFAIWNGGTAQFTDVSTLDIGSTTVVTASVTIVTAQAQLNFQTNTSGWTIKSQATFI